eukprot:XP_011682510.1 PREDICTED: mucin-7-like [Strongylocentrotus purpuratus]
MIKPNQPSMSINEPNQPSMSISSRPQPMVSHQPPASPAQPPSQPASPARPASQPAAASSQPASSRASPIQPRPWPTSQPPATSPARTSQAPATRQPARPAAPPGITLFQNPGSCNLDLLQRRLEGGNEEPPVLVCPDDVTAETEAGAAFGIISWTSPTATDNSGEVTVETDFVPGQLPIGSRNITVTATDASGNTAECVIVATVVVFSRSFTVSVTGRAGKGAAESRRLQGALRFGPGLPRMPVHSLPARHGLMGVSHVSHVLVKV